MLNDIRLHLHSNEETQIALEKEQADKLHQQFTANNLAFAQHIPSIAAAIANHSSTQFSIFVDQNSEINIINITSGKTFYTFDVDNEIDKQVSNWPLHSAVVDLQNLESQKTVNPRQSFEQFVLFTQQLQKNKKNFKIDTLVILGIGKGRHINPLIDDSSAQNIVIYEPSWELFYCSLYCVDWQQILSKAAIAEKRIFLQIGDDAANIYKDLNELKTVFSTRRIWFFKHYNYPSFDCILNSLRQHHYYLFETSLVLENNADYQNFIMPWTPSCSLIEWRNVDVNAEIFLDNLALMEEYFPALNDQFRQYDHKNWQPIMHRVSGEINLFHLPSSTFLNTELSKEKGYKLAEHLKRYPNRDGLVFGSKREELKHYLHSTFVRRTATVLKAQSDEVGLLPENIKALIYFGTEVGYTIEALAHSKSIDFLIVCEPNSDFFYASLFAIDWCAIIRRMDEAQQRIYINIGEAGSYLFSDISGQFARIGSYVLNETYFIQGYDNEQLKRPIKELRDQLAATFSLGETLDHVLYGIEHTKRVLEDGVPVMASKPDTLLSKSLLSLPVFIVGNGPSLDESIEVVSANRQKIIVVSCGTALQALHRYGITPDFHAEIEQNRVTYDWASRVNAPDFLKSITLISVNGIHPDTSGLYKDTLIAFKAGESSTSTAMSLLGMERFSTLRASFPTVANLAVDFFTTLGFQQLYLVGVDLGFINYDNHHSKQSGYFEDGKSILDYQKKLAKSLPMRGNFREQVFTKVEFNMSRTMMEQRLDLCKIDCFNLSDGVYIEGAVPLTSEQVLITNEVVDFTAMHEELRQAFIKVEGDIIGLYNAAFSQSLLNQQLDRLLALSNLNLTSTEQVNDLVEQLRTFLNDALRERCSLFGYYFFGSLNYFCATLSKAAMASDDEQVIGNANKILQYWRRLLDDFIVIVSHKDSALDSAAAFVQKRERLNLARSLKSSAPTFCVFNANLKAYFTSCCDDDIKITSHLSLNVEDSIVFISAPDDVKVVVNSIVESGTHQRILVLYCEIDIISSALIHQAENNPNVCLCYIPFSITDKNLAGYIDGDLPICSAPDVIHFAKARLLDVQAYQWIIFKPEFSETGLIRATGMKRDEYTSSAIDFIEEHLLHMADKFPVYSFRHYIAITAVNGDDLTITDSLGSRGLRIQRSLASYELLGGWQTRENVVEIIKQLQEHKLSV